MGCGDRCVGGLSTEVILIRTVFSGLWCREKWLFALIGGSVALAGHGLLKLLIGVGCAAALANALQAVATLQLNFVANGHLTWRARVAGSGVGLGRRWGRFHLARGASLLARLRTTAARSATATKIFARR